MKNIDVKTWKKQIANDTEAVILDVRTEDEVAEGVISGAVHMDVNDPVLFMEKAEGLDKSKNYYVYCRSGRRSELACAVLESIGIDNTFNLEGGFLEWNNRQ